METLTIRQLEPEVKKQLRLRAAQNGRSMEAEARQLLRQALTPDVSTGESFGDVIRNIVEPTGGIELDISPRPRDRELPDFG